MATEIPKHEKNVSEETDEWVMGDEVPLIRPLIVTPCDGAPMSWKPKVVKQEPTQGPKEVLVQPLIPWLDTKSKLD